MIWKQNIHNLTNKLKLKKQTSLNGPENETRPRRSHQNAWSRSRLGPPGLIYITAALWPVPTKNFHYMRHVVVLFACFMLVVRGLMMKFGMFYVSLCIFLCNLLI